jgi:two-component system KDP operon response regulator KdpE
MNKEEILIIDDEPQIRKLLEINLESQGYKVKQADTATMGLQLAANHPPDLILLDIGLPDMSGQDLLIELKNWYNQSIIIISVLDNEEEIVRALDNGASDYITKPFRTNELLARIRACLNRNKVEDNKTVSIFNDLQLDLLARTVTKDNENVKLTATEYKLLVLFAKNAGRVLTHQFILKEIWGVGFQTDTQYLRVFVGTLRKKIEQNPNKPLHIITESGVGYRFV